MISAKFLNRLSGRDGRCVEKHLQQSQFWAREKIRSYQLEKLKKLIAQAALNVPYYKRVFKEIGAEPQDIRTWRDFQQVPFLTKEIIKNNFDDLIAYNVNRQELISNATGGSTGEPLSFYQDRKYKLWADAARRRGWYTLAGCEYGDTCAVIWGAMHEVKKDFTLPERLRSLLKTGEVWLNAFNLSEPRKQEFYRLCNLVKPKLLRGYTTAIIDFAKFLVDNKLDFPRLNGVILCAETVTDDMQEFIESAFGAPSFNTYGGREMSLIAMQCKHKRGLHEVAENNLVEYDPVTLEGYPNAGEIVVTNLNNFAMPFIRYKNGDLGVPGKKADCPCGRGLPLIEKVIGRTTEVLVFYDGTKIAGEMFIHLMKDFPLNEYQFLQKSDREILLRYVWSDRVDSTVLNNIRTHYARFLPEGVLLSFEGVEKIHKTRTGKFRFVCQSI